MRSAAIALLASSALLAPFASAPLASAAPDTTTTEAAASSISTPDAATTNRTLDSLARKLAVAVAGADVRHTIHDAVGKRFDGDTNALWSSVAQTSTLNAKVAAAARRGRTANKETADQIAHTTRALPRLQLAVPAQFDSWDPGAYAPLVAYFPEGTQDTQVDTITAYDSNGTAVQLDAKVPPKEPVIVLGLNERTDESGTLVPQGAVTGNPTRNETGAVAAAATSYQVRMYLIYLKSDLEPWPKGDAEISMKAKSRGCADLNYSETNWTNLNNTGDAWQGPKVLGHTRCDVVFYWWEDDGGKYNFTLTYGGFNLGVKMDDGDDLIGGTQVKHSLFAGAGTNTWNKREWSALWQYTD